jgi:hypothetical protein
LKWIVFRRERVIATVRLKSHLHKSIELMRTNRNQTLSLPGWQRAACYVASSVTASFCYWAYRELDGSGFFGPTIGLHIVFGIVAYAMLQLIDRRTSAGD